MTQVVQMFCYCARIWSRTPFLMVMPCYSVETCISNLNCVVTTEPSTLIVGLIKQWNLYLGSVLSYITFWEHRTRDSEVGKQKPERNYKRAQHFLQNYMRAQRRLRSAWRRFRYPITKTDLFKYIENFTTKTESFQIQILIFSHFCSKHRLWVLVIVASVRRF